MKNWIKPGITLVLIVVLFATGLHTEVIGGVQRLLLSTGLMKPDISNTVIAQAASSGQTNDYKYDFSLEKLSGEKINISELKGKTVFVNIWATWCPPCIAEMPSIHSLYEKADSTKVAFVMLSVDKQKEKATKFIDRKDYEFPVYFPVEGLPEDFLSRAIPTTFVLGPDGSIVLRHEGMANYDTSEFLEFLEKTSGVK